VSPTGEEYGEARLRELLKTRRDASPEDIREAILTSVGEFLAAATPRDDLTLLVARLGAPRAIGLTVEEASPPALHESRTSGSA
jgi:hypothetical protein